MTVGKVEYSPDYKSDTRQTNQAKVVQRLAGTDSIAHYKSETESLRKQNAKLLAFIERIGSYTGDITEDFPSLALEAQRIVAKAKGNL